jgi:hypothetical protein
VIGKAGKVWFAFPAFDHYHILSDFYIGGFALCHCGAALTRDGGIYGKYFPDLSIYDT